jgi:hypothetical protein
MQDLKAQHVCKKNLLYTRKNAMGILKMFTVDFGVQSMGGNTFQCGDTYMASRQQ